MALPASASTTVIQGRILDVTGMPLAVDVTFTPVPERIVVRSGDTTLYNRPVSASTDATTGAWTVEVLSSDDPDLDPTNWTYTVTFQGSGVDDTIPGVPAPKDAPVVAGKPTIDITDLVTGSVSSGVGVAYRLAGLADVDVNTTPAADGQALIWNATTGAWQPGDVSSITTWDELQGKPATFTPATHTHPTSAITGLDTTLAGKASQAYVQSRGTDLVANGTGLLGDNTNFTGFTFDAADRPVGASGSFNTAPGVAGQYFVDELIPVDINKRYKLTFQAKNKGSAALGYMYGAIVPYDSDGLSFNPSYYMYLAGTDTTLAQALNVGDTVVHLTNATGWNNATGSAVYRRRIMFWDYVDGKGKLWPPHTYTRNFGSSSGTWADGAINYTDNTITLSAPFPGPSKPAGTPVSQGNSGATLMYVSGAQNVQVPQAWTSYSGLAYGGLHSDTTLQATSMFPPATAAIKISWLVNRTVSGGTEPTSIMSIAGVSFSDVSEAWRLADQANTGLAGKANTVHTHAQADVTALATALAGKAATVHTHAQADITGLSTTLAAKADSTNALTVPRPSTGTWPARPTAQVVTWIDTLPGTPKVPPGMANGDLYFGPDGMVGLAAGGTP